MNNVSLYGTMIRDCDHKMTSTGMGVCQFTIAVQRKTKDKTTGKYESDYINCIAFGKTADNIANYVHAKDKFAVVGRIQTRNYEKDGRKVYVTEVVVDSFDFPVKQQSSGGSPFSSMGVEQGDFSF